MDQLCNIFAHARCCCRRCTRNDISFCIAFFIFFFRFTFQLTDHKENRNRSRVKIASHALSRALRVSLFDHMCLCAQLITFSRLVTLYFFYRRCSSYHSREERSAINHFPKLLLYLVKHLYTYVF